MNYLKKILSTTVPLLLAGSANALSFSDVDVDGNEGEPTYQYMASWSTSNWDKTFNLLTAGFDPATMEIISATVSFAFADTKWDRADNKSWKKEYATIVVGGETLWNNIEVDGSHKNEPFNYDWYSKGLNSSLIAQLQDGIIDYSVQAVSGDFYLKEASLTVEAERSQVSDTGATLAMLGVGVASLVVLRRQMMKSQAA